MSVKNEIRCYTGPGVKLYWSKLRMKSLPVDIYFSTEDGANAVCITYEFIRFYDIIQKYC